MGAPQLRARALKPALGAREPLRARLLLRRGGLARVLAELGPDNVQLEQCGVVHQLGHSGRGFAERFVGEG